MQNHIKEKDLMACRSEHLLKEKQSPKCCDNNGLKKHT